MKCELVTIKMFICSNNWNNGKNTVFGEMFALRYEGISIGISRLRKNNEAKEMFLKQLL